MDGRAQIDPALAAEYRKRVEHIAELQPLRERYRKMNAVLNELLRLLTAGAPYAFAGPYAQMEYVVDTMSPDSSKALRRLRLHCRYAHRLQPETTEAEQQDVATLGGLIDLLEGRQPERRDASTDAPGHQAPPRPQSAWSVARVSVVNADRLTAVVVARVDGDDNYTEDLSRFGYMKPWLRRGTTLNLVYFSGRLTYAVYEPDLLIDATTIAKCKTPYADDHRLATICKLRPGETSRHIVLGNLAGQFLCETLSAMRRGEGAPPTGDYARSVRHFFRRNALELAATEDIDPEWHDEAKRQQRNTAAALETLRRADSNFNLASAITEASLLGQALGVQGRADLMQTDWRLLVEQKSGKLQTYGRVGAKEEHYAQMMLYRMMMDICYGKYAKTDTHYLLYSKYPPSKGLIREGSSVSEHMGQDLLRFRNAIAHDNLRHTEAREIERDLMAWSAETFRQKSVSDRLWEPYSKPGLEQVLNPIQDATPLERAYVFEMLAFAQREDIIGRLGGSRHGRAGFASLWTSSADERTEAGEAMPGLRFERMEQDEKDDIATDGGSDEGSIIVFAAPKDGTEPNFRPGDSVVLYDYAEGDEPDALASIDIRGTLLALDLGGTVRVKLRSATPRNSFDKEGRVWVMDHDMIGSSTGRQWRQVASLLRAAPERRDLLLAQRRPRVETAGRPKLDHGGMNGMVELQMASRDLFLLVGPPGTGKTSFGLMSILREELARAGSSVLLLSYTNRAVDEICSKLEKDGLAYIRIGPRFSCAQAYRGRLLSMMEMPDVGAVRRTLGEARIVVGTTSAINCNSDSLFALKSFALAIVDEASQILEPQIVGILSATTADAMGRRRPSVGRFVLIGDEKQLPAVVQQRRTQSVVTDERLNGIGLMDCRDSLFERLMRLYGDDPRLTFRLTRHGRMHPEVAKFCNEHFYRGQLVPIPLDHQRATLGLAPERQDSPLRREIASRRVMFVDSHCDTAADDAQQTDKVNPHEADMVARIAHDTLMAWRTAGRTIEAGATLGIVVPYRNQIAAIRSRLQTLASDDETRRIVANMTIDTVERLQGSERDVIIYGFTVRTLSQLEFLKESQYADRDGTIIDRKLNVALSRAREQLIVVGDKRIISAVPLFAALTVEMPEIKMQQQQTLRE